MTFAEAINDFISFGLTWAFIGASIWAWHSQSHIDFVVRNWTRRRGVLPGNGVVVLAVLWAIVKWPVLAAALWRQA